MRRVALALLVLALPVAADELDTMREQLDKGRLEAALATAKEVLKKGPDKEIKQLEGVAKRLLVARHMQRERGYRASLEYLELQLDHWRMAEAYGEAARWAGEEQRGLDKLRRCKLPLGHRIHAELHLLQALQRYAEIERRAAHALKTIDWDKLRLWAQVAREDVRLRERLREQGERAKWVSVVALAVLLGGCAVVWRLAPS